MSDPIQISSPELQVSISSMGAEITSIRNKEGIEFIWNADPEIWPRHAPVLFPIVGRLKNDAFRINGSEYRLGQHGFARDLPFTVSKKDRGSVTLELSSSGMTKKNYPFDFLFRIAYQLEGNTLTTDYEVQNRGNGAMYFSVGAHPGFACPFGPNEKFEDYSLEFGTRNYSLSALDAGLRSGDHYEININDGRLPLSVALFDKDALVFENGQIDSVTLRSAKNDRQVRLDCKGWPYFGIWSKKGCNRFVCLEPWYGIADRTDATGALEDKEGIIKLESGGRFSASFGISLV